MNVRKKYIKKTFLLPYRLAVKSCSIKKVFQFKFAHGMRLRKARIKVITHIHVRRQSGRKSEGGVRERNDGALRTAAYEST